MVKRGVRLANPLMGTLSLPVTKDSSCFCFSGDRLCTTSQNHCTTYINHIATSSSMQPWNFASSLSAHPPALLMTTDNIKVSTAMMCTALLHSPTTPAAVVTFANRPRDPFENKRPLVSTNSCGLPQTAWWAVPKSLQSHHTSTRLMARLLQVYICCNGHRKENTTPFGAIE